MLFGGHIYFFLLIRFIHQQNRHNVHYLININARKLKNKTQWIDSCQRMPEIRADKWNIFNWNIKSRTHSPQSWRDRSFISRWKFNLSSIIESFSLSLSPSLSLSLSLCGICVIMSYETSIRSSSLNVNDLLCILYTIWKALCAENNSSNSTSKMCMLFEVFWINHSQNSSFIK